MWLLIVSKPRKIKWLTLAGDPRVEGTLTGGSAEEAAFSSLTKATRLRVGVAAVSFFPPFKLRRRPRAKFPRFHHFRD